MKNHEIETPYYEFFRLEKEMELFSLRFKGIYYWQLVRAILLKGITTKDLHVAAISAKRSVVKEIFGSMIEAFRMWYRFKGITPSDIVYLRPSARMAKDSAVLDDPQFDYTNLSEKYKVFDLFALGDYAEIPDCVRFDMSEAEIELIFWKIRRKIFQSTKFPYQQEKILRDFLYKINIIYKTDFNIENLIKQIQYAVKCHCIYKKWFNIILKKIKPQIIIETTYYDEHMYAANDAAKDLGIRTIEMQHGRINAHEDYWYEDQSVIGKILPDYFFSFGEWWNQQINMPDFCKVVSVGNPYLEKQIEIYKYDEKDHLILSVFSNPQNGKILSEFIFSIQEYCIEHNIEILYKLHPNEKDVWKKEYPRLLEMKNATIYESGSVYDILSRSNITIGVNSTTFFEALAYDNLQIFIYTVGDYEGMKPLITNSNGYSSKYTRRIY